MTHDRFVVVLISPNEATSPPSTSPTPNLPAESEVANDIPGTALTFDTAVSSVVDVDTEIRDVYALELTAGQEVQFGVDGFRRATLRFTLAAPGSSSFVTGGISKEFELSDSSTPWQHSFAPATSGTYYLEVKATKEGQNYNLTVTPS